MKLPYVIAGGSLRKRVAIRQIVKGVMMREGSIHNQNNSERDKGGMDECM